MAEIDRFKLQLQRMRQTEPPRRSLADMAWLQFTAAIGIAIAAVAIFGGPADRLSGYLEQIVSGQSNGGYTEVRTNGHSSGDYTELQINGRSSDDYAEDRSDGQSRGQIAGSARVVDGDTIKIGGKRIRLFGIDAPESSQHCRDATGTDYSCGHNARAALATMVDGQTVQCEQRDTDRYGRAVATCTVNGRDLGGALVDAGSATAYRHYSSRYEGNEDSARHARRGVWAGSFEKPRDYRRNHR